MEQAAQGSGGVPIPGGVQKMCRHGTLGHGLVGVVMLGWQLDLMILEVFSNLNDSVMLWFHDLDFWWRLTPHSLHMSKLGVSWAARCWCGMDQVAPVRMWTFCHSA